jgi:hypothetical protein
MVFAGTPIPKVAGAFTTTLTLFRNLRLYGLVDFKQGHKRFNTDKWIRCDVFANCEEAVTPAGRDPLLLADMALGADLQTINSFIEDAGFFKLREISASYTLPDRWAAAIGAQRAVVTATGRNLHTWTSYTGLDPDRQSPQGQAAPLDFFDQAVTPPLAQFLMTISLNF